MILNNSNLDIFVCSHKQYESPVHNKVYKTLSVGNNTELYGENIIRDDTGDNKSDMNGFYSELTGTYWIWKNYDIKDYVGICHYRRYFDFLDNLPNNLEEYDIILPTPLNFGGTIYQQYAACHNKEDIKLIYDIMINKYNVPVEVGNEVFNNQTYMHCWNMFIINKAIFNDYCEFVFGVLDEYLKYHNISNINDIYSMIEKQKNAYLKSYYPNNEIKYQSRLGGFFGERLLNVYIKWKGLKVKTFNIIQTESKYKEVKTNDFL